MLPSLFARCSANVVRFEPAWVRQLIMRLSFINGERVNVSFDYESCERAGNWEYGRKFLSLSLSLPSLQLIAGLFDVEAFLTYRCNLFVSKGSSGFVNSLLIIARRWKMKDFFFFSFQRKWREWNFVNETEREGRLFRLSTFLRIKIIQRKEIF